MDNIPEHESIDQSLFRLILDMDRFGGEEDTPMWADVLKPIGERYRSIP
jgi:hypothetical protein